MKLFLGPPSPCFESRRWMGYFPWCSKVLLGILLASTTNSFPNIMTQPNRGLLLAHPPSPRRMFRSLEAVSATGSAESQLSCPHCLLWGPVAVCIQLMGGGDEPWEKLRLRRRAFHFLSGSVGDN